MLSRARSHTEREKGREGEVITCYICTLNTLSGTLSGNTLSISKYKLYKTGKISTRKFKLIGIKQPILYTKV